MISIWLFQTALKWAGAKVHCYFAQDQRMHSISWRDYDWWIYRLIISSKWCFKGYQGQIRTRTMRALWPCWKNITPILCQCLEDWRCLVQCMTKETTSVMQLIMLPTSYISYTYDCKVGAGGVWCSGTPCMKPLLWQVIWPCDIQDSLVTVETPNESITINNLELSGALLDFLVL